MPGAVRALCDINVGVGSHGRKCCLHGLVGIVPMASSNVFINGSEAVRRVDIGVHGACCGTPFNTCIGASGSVFINGRGAVRTGDMVLYFCGIGFWVTGSGNVIIGG